MCAIASITFDEQFVIKGIRILNIQNRYMVCMPSRRGQDGEHRDVAHPVNARARKLIDDCILLAFEEERRRHAAGEGPDGESSGRLVEDPDHSFCGPGG